MWISCLYPGWDVTYWSPARHRPSSTHPYCMEAEAGVCLCRPPVCPVRLGVGKGGCGLLRQQPWQRWSWTCGPPPAASAPPHCPVPHARAVFRLLFGSPGVLSALLAGRRLTPDLSSLCLWAPLTILEPVLGALLFGALTPPLSHVLQFFPLSSSFDFFLMSFVR